jgi:hypothetical protein
MSHSSFHTSMTSDVYHLLRKYVMAELDLPVWEFFTKEVVPMLQREIEQIGKEEIEQAKKTGQPVQQSKVPKLRDLFVEYCRSFPKLNEDEIKQTVDVFWRLAPEGAREVIGHALSFSIRNRAETLSSVYSGDSSQLSLNVSIPDQARFAHKWLSLICGEIARSPNVLLRRIEKDAIAAQMGREERY